MADTDGRNIIAAMPADFDDLEFAEMSGSDQISVPFKFDLVVAGEDIEKDPLGILGKPIGITVGATEEVQRYFHGYVTDFGYLKHENNYAHYAVTLRPWLWFLGNRTDCRIFQNMSVVEIIEEVFALYPNAAYELRLQGTYDPREYCVQYDESDLTFVQRLMEHEGMFYFFEYADGAHTMILTDDNAKLETVPDFEEVPYRVDVINVAQEQDYIDQWVSNASVRSGAYAHVDYDFTKPGADLMSLQSDPTGHDQDDAEVYSNPGSHLDLGRGDDIALIRLQELQAAQTHAEAHGTVRGLWAGARFDFVDFAREIENDTYFVLRARYHMVEAAFAAGMGGQSQGFEVVLEVSRFDIPYRPARLTKVPVMRGPQTAVVVGPAGEEIYTDEYSRVKVQFHWDRLGEDDENSSCFVRVSSVWAGSGWGFIQIPRIGQEVIVDFIEGDPDKPIITGRVYNQDQMPPYGLPDNATQSGWKSNSSPGGGGSNEMRFEDKAGEEEIWIHAQKDQNEVVENDDTRTVHHDMMERVDNDSTQSIGGFRHELVEKDKDTTIDGHRIVHIKQTDTETVDLDRSLTVNGSETIHVVGSSTEDIDMNHFQTVGLAQKILVKGARKDDVGLAEVRAVGGLRQLTIGKQNTVRVGSNSSFYVQAEDSYEVKGNQTTTIHQNHTSKVDGDQSLTLKGNQSFDITGGRMVKVKKGQTHDVTESVWVKSGEKMMLEAKDSITLKTGDASITLESDGTITIKGKDLALDGSGKITIKASNEVKINGSKVTQN